jgi:hypothetical protein
MRRRKRNVRPPPDPGADPWARTPGEEIPLIEAQDPSLIDQQEGPIESPIPPPDRAKQPG